MEGQVAATRGSKRDGGDIERRGIPPCLIRSPCGIPSLSRKSGDSLKKTALWQILVSRGYCASRGEATAWIMAGSVLCNEERIDKPGTPISNDATIRIRGFNDRFVSRGGYKIEAAITTWGIDVGDRVALDAGASTGGFTDCLIQHGASRVYAVDVGYGQIAGKLRADSRVVVMERINLGDPSLQNLVPRPEIVTLDLSYLSLQKAIPITAKIIHSVAVLLCLVKPLFETDDNNARRTGRRFSDDELIVLLDRVVTYGKLDGLEALGVIASPIRGTHGTREFVVGFMTRHGGELVARREVVTSQDIADAVSNSTGAEPEL
jgi:23S rRNA (cytidine1920-2'-O)/16S rRNA (cytidine1409-2'-O)-methyltransferase